MRIATTLLLLLLSTAIAYAQDASVESILQKEYASLETLYKHLHQNPELSYYEEKTSARIAEELRKLGFEVTEKFGQFKDPKLTSYGVVAVMKNGAGPTVMVRTDLDALPMPDKTGVPYPSQAKGINDNGEEVPVTHGCGHDMHMTVFVGTARALSAMKNRWKGTLIMIGQPAEERGVGGAEAMLNGGLYTKFPKPDYVLALHNDAGLETGKVGIVEGYALAAMDSPDIILRGAGGHGAYPYLTKDPIVMASEVVMGLQTIVAREVEPGKPAVVTVGSMHSGTKRNIIPDEARLELTVRSYEKEVRDKVLASIERIAKGIAQSAGGEAIVNLKPQEYIPATYNNPDLAKKLTPVLESAVGKGNAVTVRPVMGAEDFSRFSLEDHSIPCFLFWVGTVDPAKVADYRKAGKTLPSLHSSLFAPVPEPTIRTGVKAMTAAALHLLQ